jgi:hypothetical protein
LLVPYRTSRHNWIGFFGRLRLALTPKEVEAKSGGE